MSIETTMPASALAEVAGEFQHSYRTERFLTRIDAHLAGCTPQQARQFLAAQIGAWERAYARFVLDADEPSAHDDPPSASDYVLTLVGLGSRLDRLNEEGRHGSQ